MTSNTTDQVILLPHSEDSTKPTLVSRNDPLHMEELFVRSERSLSKFLVQMVGDRELAEDLLQDVFHDAIRGQARLSAADNPTAWLFGIARNHALNSLRRQRRLRRAIELFGRQQQTSNAADFDTDVVAIRDLLERSLEPDDRSLILLRYLYRFEATEIAAMSGRTPESVRQRLSRARKVLVAVGADAPGHGSTTLGGEV